MLIQYLYEDFLAQCDYITSVLKHNMSERKSIQLFVNAYTVEDGVLNLIARGVYYNDIYLSPSAFAPWPALHRKTVIFTIKDQSMIKNSKSPHNKQYQLGRRDTICPSYFFKYNTTLLIKQHYRSENTSCKSV